MVTGETAVEVTGQDKRDKKNERWNNDPDHG